ncbi:MAG: MFS transporter [Gemmatimonadetes bacterium]|nr:MFS transporter [Gemmatimonadota bacterium]
MSLLDRLGLHRRELRAWAMYDWANSAMVTTIVTAVFPIYFVRVAGADLEPAMATRRLADITTIGLGIIAVLSPIMGTIADRAGVKKRLLGISLGVGVSAVALMFLIQRGDLLLASLLFVVANIAVNASYVCYDSFLPHIARGDEMDRVSTAGYALGYVGGGVLLAFNLAWIKMPHWFGLPSGPDLTPAQATLPTRLAFVSVAVWWLVFSIPLFRHVPEPPPTGDGRIRIGKAFGELGDTFRQLGKFPQALLMLIAFLIYNDGIGTIIRMATGVRQRDRHRRRGPDRRDHDHPVRGDPLRLPVRRPRGEDRVSAPSPRLGRTMVISMLGYRMQTARDFLVLALLVGVVQGELKAVRLAVREHDPPAALGGVLRVLRGRGKIRGSSGRGSLPG